MVDTCADAGSIPKSYHEALGRFIEEFASTEGFMHLLLWHYAKVDPGVGKAVLSGMGTTKTIESIGRIKSVVDPGELAKATLKLSSSNLSPLTR
jgi:hypothetical protein